MQLVARLAVRWANEASIQVGRKRANVVAEQGEPRRDGKQYAEKKGKAKGGRKKAGWQPPKPRSPQHKPVEEDDDEVAHETGEAGMASKIGASCAVDNRQYKERHDMSLHPLTHNTLLPKPSRPGIAIH